MNIDKQELDRHITGNYGEDALTDDPIFDALDAIKDAMDTLPINGWDEYPQPLISGLADLFTEIMGYQNLMLFTQKWLEFIEREHFELIPSKYAEPMIFVNHLKILVNGDQ